MSNDPFMLVPVENVVKPDQIATLNVLKILENIRRDETNDDDDENYPLQVSTVRSLQRKMSNPDILDSHRFVLEKTLTFLEAALLTPRDPSARFNFNEARQRSEVSIMEQPNPLLISDRNGLPSPGPPRGFHTPDYFEPEASHVVFPISLSPPTPSKSLSPSNTNTYDPPNLKLNSALSQPILSNRSMESDMTPSNLGNHQVTMSAGKIKSKKNRQRRAAGRATASPPILKQEDEFA